MRNLRHGLILIAVAVLALQMFFVLRVGAMRWIDPQSTAFERSQIWALASSARAEHKPFVWKQQWQPYERISDHVKRAVIASEDSDFAEHDGIEWEAIEKAWQRNTQAEQSAEQRSKRVGKPIAPKLIGGSTITQQLAKNLFLAPERTYLRKGQEIFISYTLELLLSKERILEIYLNHVELGQGVFGFEAAARHYYKKGANELTREEAARLAVMLPRPKYFEKTPQSAYIAARTQTILARMAQVQLPPQSK